jgi:hypothetical protein
MKDYDLKQPKLMLNKIHEFEANRLRFHRLVRDLKGLIALLSPDEAALRTALQSKWAVLEEVYPVASDLGLNSIPRENETLVHRSLEEMENLLKESIGRSGD